MTPEERERLTKQLTIITGSLSPAPKKTAPTAPVLELPRPSAEAPDGTIPEEKALEVAPPKPQKPPRRPIVKRWRRWRVGLFLLMAALAFIGTGLAEGLSPQVFRFSSQLLGLVPAPPTATLAPTETPFDDIARSPTITVTEIDRVLQSVNSPMIPYSYNIYVAGIQYGIDPVFALAFWMKESREASDGSVAAPDHNPGYTEGLATDPRCGRWACWPTWPEGIAGWFHYMRVFFVDRGIRTVEDILPIYAPSSENNTSGYIVFVLQHVATWRAESAANR
jgi:hypothetical protein